MMNPFVYALVDPQDPKHVRYVGMAPVRSFRPYEHAKEARKSAATTYKLRWIRKIQTEGRDPSVLLLETLPAGTTTSLLGFVESCYIKSLREIGHRLTNASDGGVGRTGPLSMNARANMVVAAHIRWQNPGEREKARQGSLGKIPTGSTREKLRVARLVYVALPGVRESIGSASRGRVQSVEARLKRSSSMLGNTNGAGSTHTSEERVRIRERTLGNKNRLGCVHKESSKKQCSDTNKVTWADPVKRAEHSALMKSSWARRKALKEGAKCL